MPVAYEVAICLGAELEVLVARKVGAPGHAELGIGAIAEGGVRVADASLRMLAISDVEFERLADADCAVAIRAANGSGGARWRGETYSWAV